MGKNPSRPVAGQVNGLKARLRNEIWSGSRGVGVRLEEKELQRETGCSIMAIRRALSDLAKEGLLERKRRAGTFVAARAETAVPVQSRSLRKVALLSGYPEALHADSVYSILILSGIRQALPPGADFQIIAPNSRSHWDIGVDNVPAMDTEAKGHAFDGIIGLENTNGTQFNALIRKSLPVVAIDFHADEALFDSISIDYQKAGFLATSHLITLGHRRIALVGEAPLAFSTDPVWQDRTMGYLRALAVAGIAPQLDWILSTKRSAEFIRKRLPEFHRLHRPTAYVLADANFAVAFLETLGEMGLHCPADVSVSCATGVLNQVCEPILSRVVTEHKRLGIDAVQLLAARLANPSQLPVRVLRTVEFSAGESSRRIG